jgi:GntR family transcriptional regulator
LSEASRTAGRERGHVGYKDIAAVLIDEIRDGVWEIGQQLPAEAVLVERFGVSRNTIREALRELQDVGLLGKKRGARSVILRSEVETSFVNSIRSVDEMMEYAHGAHNRLVSSERLLLLEEQARQLDCPEGSEWIRLQVVRSTSPAKPPFCYSAIYLDPRYEKAARDPRATKAAYTAIEDLYDVTVARVIQEIEPIAANEAIAIHLQVPVGAPVLLARSRFYDGRGGLIEVGLAHFAPGRYKLRLALDRRQA